MAAGETSPAVLEQVYKPQGEAFATSRLGASPQQPGGSGITLGQDVLDGLHLLLDCQELLAKSSTVSPKRPPCEMETSRKRTFSASHISPKFSQRWHSWTNVDIVWTRACTVTFFTQRVRSFTVCSSCINLSLSSSVLWPDGFAGWPSNERQRWPVQLHCEP